VGIGDFSDAEQGFAAMRETDEQLSPDPKAAQRYDSNFARYREIYRAAASQ
jgi:sugar (pentulose or hexulose) kinase